MWLLVVRLLLLSDTLLHSACGIRWLALQHLEAASWDAPGTCRVARERHGLSRRQQALCRRYRDVMRHVHVASAETATTCQLMMVNRRWNCSSLQQAPQFARDLQQGTREQALVRALSSAALSRTLARACSAGTVFSCGCGKNPAGKQEAQYQWGGCADNLKFGLSFARRFVTQQKQPARAKAARLSTKADRHNDKAGRKAIQKSMRTRCKCHGASGSCSLRTCWRSLADLRVTGEELRRRYLTATEVILKKSGPKRRLVPAHSAMAPFTSSDLVYWAKSPDYCLPDQRFGSQGTVGRVCNSSASAENSCRSLCCGRPFSTSSVQRVRRCRCKFRWCCEVRCSTCRSWEDQSTCT